MTRQEKDQFIDQLAEKLDANKNIYLTDISGLTVDASNKLRRLCFSKGVQLEVVKNTLLKKAMEKVETNYEEAYDLLVGNTALMYSESGNLPAKVIKEFRKNNEKPLLKCAYVDTSFYLGDEQVKELATLKSKDELLGEIIALLQSPAKNVISALQSGGNNLSGILKTLGDRPDVSADVSAEASTEAKEETKAREEASTEAKEEDAVAEKTSDAPGVEETKEEATDASADVSAEASTEVKEEASAEAASDESAEVSEETKEEVTEKSADAGETTEAAVEATEEASAEENKDESSDGKSEEEATETDDESSDSDESSDESTDGSSEAEAKEGSSAEDEDKKD